MSVNPFRAEPIAKIKLMNEMTYEFQTIRNQADCSAALQVDSVPVHCDFPESHH